MKKGQNVSVALDAFPGKTSRRRCKRWIRRWTPTAGRCWCVLTVDNPERTLRSGMFARARVVFETRSGAVVVPEEALVPQGDKQYVIKMIDGPQGQSVAEGGSHDGHAHGWQGGDAEEHRGR